MRLRRRIRPVTVGVAGSVGAVAAAGLAYFLLAADAPDSAAEHLARGERFAAEGATSAALVELRNAVQLEPDNRAARWGLARLLVAAGDGAGGLKEAERVEALGGGGDEVTALKLEAMLLQRRYAEVLGRLATEPRADAAPELLRLRARAQLGLEKPDAARGSYEALLAVAPADPSAAKGLARLALAERDFERAAAYLAPIVAEHGDDPDGWLLKGALELARRDAPAARQAYARAAALAPRSAAPALGLIRANLLAGEAEEAERIVQQLVADHPRVPEVRFAAASVAEMRDDPLGAIGELREVLRLVPEHPESLRRLARLLAGRGELAQALEFQRRVVRQDPADLDAQRRVGALELRQGDWEAAERTLRGVVEASANDPVALGLLGNAYLRGGRSEEAVAALERAAGLAPNAPQLRTWLALGQMSLGRFDQAVDQLEEALDQGGEGEETGVLLVLSHLRTGQRADAVDVARELTESAPDKASGWNLLGVALEASGELEAGRDAYRQARAVDPDARAARLNIARLDAASGEVEQAAAGYRGVLARHPGDARASVALAALDAQAGRNDEAVAQLENARAADPKGHAVRRSLAALYLRLGLTAEALAVAREAVEIAPDANGARALLGAAELASGRPEAVTSLRAALASAPGSSRIRVLLADALLRSGGRDEVESLLADVMPSDPARGSADALLARLRLAQGRHADALGLGERIAGSDPKVPVGWVLQGDALRGLGRPREALDRYRHAHRLAPAGTLVAAIAAALDALGERGEATAALEAWLVRQPEDATVRKALAMRAIDDEGSSAAAEYERILSSRPDDVVALNNLAWLALAEDPARALELAERAHALAGNHPSVLDTYGLALRAAGRREQALAAFRRAVDRDPRNPEHRFHLARALAEAGDRPAASAILGEVLAVPGAFRGRREAEELHAELR